MNLSRVILIASFLLMCPVLANAQHGPGCGPANVKFDISTTKQLPAPPAAQTGKALVYFLQDDLKYDFAAPNHPFRYRRCVGRSHPR